MIRTTIAACGIAAAAAIAFAAAPFAAPVAHADPACTVVGPGNNTGLEQLCGTACALTGACQDGPPTVVAQNPNCIHPISPLVAQDCARMQAGQ